MKNYAKKFEIYNNLPIFGIGICFDVNTRNVGGHKSEKIYEPFK